MEIPNMKANGKCLCGSVELEMELPNTEVAACHCSMCRTWSGGPMMALVCEGSLDISNESSVSRYSSSEWAERGFCSTCGTHLFYLLKPASQYHVPAGLLDTPIDHKFTHQIFVDEKPSYYDFSNETENMTGPEVFAHFAGEQ